jgi:triphosphoribosyl-dephospho-CoA synthase
VSTFSPGDLGRIACTLEVLARKPGNVHRLRDFEDAGLADFLLSAAVLGRGLGLARDEGVGAAVLAAVEDARRVVRTNANLGMVLLLAPLAAVPEGAGLREGVEAVLERTTVEDARRVYRAIGLANPGGLGRSAEQDVADEPTVTLREAMRLASGRDGVARQYAEGFGDVFAIGLPRLSVELRRGRSLEAAILACHLELMARRPDTLIARKRGDGVAAEAARRAAEVLDAGWPDAPGSGRRLAALDDWLRADGHARNPGTTADLVCASIYAALREGVIALPIEDSWRLPAPGARGEASGEDERGDGRPF